MQEQTDQTEQMVVPGLEWQTSTYTATDNCVRLAPHPDGGVAVSDSKVPEGAMLHFAASAWADFAQAWGRGHFNWMVNPGREGDDRAAYIGLGQRIDPSLIWHAAPNADAAHSVRLAQVPGGGVAMSDSAFPDGAVLYFTASEMTAFCRGWADGQFMALNAA